MPFSHGSLLECNYLFFMIDTEFYTCMSEKLINLSEFAYADAASVCAHEFLDRMRNFADNRAGGPVVQCHLQF